MTWDFSAVSPQGDAGQIEQRMYNHINDCIEQFKDSYRNFLNEYIIICDPTDIAHSFQSVLRAVLQTEIRLYLLIDEYDNLTHDG